MIFFCRFRSLSGEEHVDRRRESGDKRIEDGAVENGFLW